MKSIQLTLAFALTWLIPTPASTAFGQSNPRYIRISTVHAGHRSRAGLKLRFRRANIPA